MIRFDTHELASLAVEFDKIASKATPTLLNVFRDGADDLVKAWAANARETSGEHGKHYPNSIDHEMHLSTDIVFEIGPNPRRPQGGMSFEYGSVNQPPHLDGQRAADVEIPRIDRRIQSTLAYLGL